MIPESSSGAACRGLAVGSRSLCGRTPGALRRPSSRCRGRHPGRPELARRLGAPLDVWSCASSACREPRSSRGERREDGTRVVRPDVAELATPKRSRGRRQEGRELQRRERMDRNGHATIDVRGRTGHRRRRRARDRRAMPSRRSRCARATGAVAVAVPVAPRRGVPAAARPADEVVCLHAGDGLRSVGSAYEDFSQTADEEVARCSARLEAATCQRWVSAERVERDRRGRSRR